MARRALQWTAPHSVRYFPAGFTCTDPVAGDVIIVDRGSILPRLIKTGEWVIANLPLVGEPELKPYTWCDHVAFIREDVPGVFTVSQMEATGHQIVPLEGYRANDYAVAHFDVADELRALVLAADARCAGIEYGFFQYPFLALGGVSGGKLAVAYGSSMVCSTEVATCGENIYWTSDRNAAAVIPSRIALWVGAGAPPLSGKVVGV